MIKTGLKPVGIWSSGALHRIISHDGCCSWHQTGDVMILCNSELCGWCQKCWRWIRWVNKKHHSDSWKKLYLVVWSLSIKTPALSGTALFLCICLQFIYFVNAFITIQSNQFIASSLARWSLFRPPSDSIVRGHSFTICDIVCAIPHSHLSEDARLHLCRFAAH